jgi:hypothetical protein
MKIKDYANETPILTGDKVLGTAAADNATKNFTVDELVNFVEDNIVVPIDADNLTYTVYDGLVANNTTSSTTTILNHGVNVITTATSTNLACKLPQPVTGKELKIVNMSSRDIKLFPSNVGGKINNYAIDAPATIPADGKSYSFICIENPLPGEWVWSAPATAQIEFAEMSVSHTNGTASSVYGIGVNTTLANSGCYLSGAGNIVEVTPGRNGHLLFPATAAKTKVYTNIVAGDLVGDVVVERIVYYKIGLNSAIDLSANDYMKFGSTSGVGTYNTVDECPVGTLTTAPNQNVGDTGTFYSSVSNNSNIIGKQLGTGGAFSGYYWRYAMNIPASAATKTYKFKIFLEYYS